MSNRTVSMTVYEEAPTLRLGRRVHWEKIGWTLTWIFDMTIETIEAQRETIKPARIMERPRPSDWDLDEPLTLAEAAALFWPLGPLTPKSLRTAVEDGQLAVATVAGKLFTCPRAVKEMIVYAKRTGRRTKPDASQLPETCGGSDLRGSTVMLQERLLDDLDERRSALEVHTRNMSRPSSGPKATGKAGPGQTSPIADRAVRPAADVVSTRTSSDQPSGSNTWR